MRSTHVQPSSHRAFGHAVRELRAYRGLSQEALGHAAGLHRNYVGAIERGELNPTIRTVLRLAVGLRIRPSRLVLLAERREAAITADGSNHPPARPRCPLRIETGNLVEPDLPATKACKPV
jgi:transcriptional regulator with XRE-family HTH domain